jgi:hypothetical protein
MKKTALFIFLAALLVSCSPKIASVNFPPGATSDSYQRDVADCNFRIKMATLNTPQPTYYYRDNMDNMYARGQDSGNALVNLYYRSYAPQDSLFSQCMQAKGYSFVYK